MIGYGAFACVGRHSEPSSASISLWKVYRPTCLTASMTLKFTKPTIETQAH
jgi:hypothetical protein